MAIVAIGVVALCIYNAVNNGQFYQINIFNGITLLWTIGLSIFISQSFSRYQRKVDIIIKMLQDLLLNISEEKTCRISQKDKTEDILMRNRQIKQNISLVNQYAQKFGIKKEMDFIEKEFAEYEETVSEHISDLSYLEQSYTVLARPIKLIQARIYQAMLKL